jgi:hypothetical protein
MFGPVIHLTVKTITAARQARRAEVACEIVEI